MLFWGASAMMKAKKALVIVQFYAWLTLKIKSAAVTECFAHGLSYQYYEPCFAVQPLAEQVL